VEAAPFGPFKETEPNVTKYCKAFLPLPSATHLRPYRQFHYFPYVQNQAAKARISENFSDRISTTKMFIG